MKKVTNQKRSAGKTSSARAAVRMLSKAGYVWADGEWRAPFLTITVPACDEDALRRAFANNKQGVRLLPYMEKYIRKSLGEICKPTAGAVSESEQLKALKAKTACCMGVGSGDGNLFVYGDYDSIKAAQALLLRTEAQAEVQAEPVADWLPYSRRVALAARHGQKVTGPFNALVRDVIATYLDTHGATAPQAQPADALDAAPAAPINSEALQVIKALREWVMAVPADIAAALPAMPGIDADWMDAVEAALATHSAPADGLMVDMTPPATSRDRWMYNQGRLAEVERICAAIKTEDDYCVDQGDYMLDSDDCIKVARGTWLRPTFDRAAMAAAQEGGAA